ncbi:MAG: uracil-DNA glycosylase [Bacteroidia bacterium]|nr:uracil-DNA glycosylase [Bacteroidia bacterium]MCX7763317.1 uracil-DNA glycosylase [Bacteroidia bacterium]MDW8057096.1 uracil-DNA glycosylase [Bacteroidia bacterium]
MWEKLTESIISCKRCPRLVSYRESIGLRPPPRYKAWQYWSKPVPGFGDLAARLWVVGLAPAAHGANRTGRMFTGDSSGDWLYRALYETGFANQPDSFHKEDGLLLEGAYISAAARCAPPENRPLPTELAACFPYLSMEFQLLKPTLRVILPLGHIAYKQVARLFPNAKFPPFGHGKQHSVESITILASYHPSQQNTRTGRLRWEAWIEIFRQARQLCTE